MANSVTIRTTAPGAKQVAGEMKGLRASVMGLGTKTGGPLGGMIGALGGINPVALAAGAGIGIATGMLMEGVRGALEEEKQLGRLDQALENNVEGWDGNREAIDRSVDSMMNLAFSDDEARESMIKLITATGSVEESTRDMALAADIARGRNIDLGAATDIVIKANMGNVGALRRLGIEVRAGASSMEILTELQERYGGQAEHYANSTAGKFEAAQIKVNNAMEDFGHELITTTGGLLSFDKAMEGDSKAISEFIHAAASLSPAIRPIAEEMDKLFAQMPDKLSGTLHKVGLDNVDALAKGWADGTNHWTPEALFRAKLYGFGQTVSPYAQEVGEDVAGEVVDGFSDNFGDSIREAIPSAKDRWKDYLYAVTHPGKVLEDIAWIQGKLASKKLADGLQSSDPRIRADAENTRDFLLGLLRELGGDMGDTASDASAETRQGFNNSYPGMKQDARAFVADYNAIFANNLQTSYLVKVRNAGLDPDFPSGNNGGGGNNNGGGGMGGGNNRGNNRRNNNPNVNVNVNLSNREFSSKQKHYANLNGGRGAFQ